MNVSVVELSPSHSDLLNYVRPSPKGTCHALLLKPPQAIHVAMHHHKGGSDLVLPIITN